MPIRPSARQGLRTDPGDMRPLLVPTRPGDGGRGMFPSRTGASRSRSSPACARWQESSVQPVRYKPVQSTIARARGGQPLGNRRAWSPRCAGGVGSVDQRQDPSAATARPEGPAPRTRRARYALPFVGGQQMHRSAPGDALVVEMQPGKPPRIFGLRAPRRGWPRCVRPRMRPRPSSGLSGRAAVFRPSRETQKVKNRK